MASSGSVTQSLSPPPIPKARWRWWVHLVLLGLYPPVFALAAIFQPQDPGATEPALSTDRASFFMMLTVQLTLFALWFLAALFFSRASARDLFLVWRGGFKSVLRGALYSVGLRLAIAVVIMVCGIFFFLGGLTPEEVQERFRPKVEVLVDTEAIQNDTMYMVLGVTVVSFIMAGLREELWRAGVLGGFRFLFPGWFATTRGRIMVLLITGVLFGMGHFPQGWFAVMLTTVLGMGLGAIILWHDSVWEAVWAHGFFDATTFLLLPWAIQQMEKLKEIIPGIPA